MDNVPVSRQGIRPGDRATIYANFNVPLMQQKCYVVDVEHAVVGRVEALDPASASLVVNGQRVWLTPGTTFLGRRGIAWDAAGVATAGEVRSALSIGDLLAVSGDLTADDQIVATGITRATASQGYRVTGFARDVDPVHRQLRLGTLQVDYSSASLSGFDAGGPAAGDRITMIATTGSAAGLQIAAALKHAGGALRGEKLNFVTMSGLLTGLSGQDFSIDGRLTAPLPNAPAPGNGLERNVCDPAKLHLNLRTMLVAIGGVTDERPMRLFHVCPPGRRADAYEALPGTPADQFTLVTARVQALDPGRFTLQVAGTGMGLNPAATLTSARSSGGQVQTSPLRLQDLRVGDRVRVELPPLTGDLALVDTLWAGSAIDPSHDSVVGTVRAVSQPDLTVSNLTIHTSTGTAISYTYPDSNTCETVVGTAADLWRSAADITAGLKGPYRITAAGSFSGSTLDATTVSVVALTPCGSGEDLLF